jgi:hypothetical protein
VGIREVKPVLLTELDHAAVSIDPGGHRSVEVLVPALRNTLSGLTVQTRDGSVLDSP